MVGRKKKKFLMIYSLFIYLILSTLITEIKIFFLIQAKRFCKLHAFILMRANLQRSLDNDLHVPKTRLEKRKENLCYAVKQKITTLI